MKTPCLEPVPAARRPADAPWRLGVSAACLAARMEERVEAFACAEAENLGHLESQLAAETQELLRQAAELGAQKKADATPPRCPHCQRALTRRSAEHARTFTTRFGEVTVRRIRGYCPKCRKWRMPADAALGLAETAGYSPAVQEMTALLASKLPVGEASVVLARLTGIKVPRGHARPGG
ncbi:MAG TPA: hypothetical protein PLG56_01345, partial [Lacunisphaera sp.]|nr:hypothetical protein [Lacunisphaera sp.]